MFELNGENLLTGGKDLVHISKEFLSNTLRDTMVRNSIFAGLVFIIVANPIIFKTVGKFIKVKNPNFILLLHSVVFSLIMYFGSLYIFDPIYKGIIVEGFEGNKTCQEFYDEFKKRNNKDFICADNSGKKDGTEKCNGEECKTVCCK